MNSCSVAKFWAAGDAEPGPPPPARKRWGMGGRIGVWGHFALRLEAPTLRTDGGVAQRQALLPRANNWVFDGAVNNFS